ncbi:MAG: T9SS type A sorting domain-containing protein [Ignavibacteriales bacterium]|nr:T9SS type A sorting domain-containing protein [Ignavibacteriales bacterium]
MKQLACLLVIMTMPVHSQNPEWINLTYGEMVFALVSRGNDLWIGTDGGVVKFNKRTEHLTFYTKASANLPDNHIRSLALDFSGYLWIGTQYSGAGKFDGIKCQVFNSGNSALPVDGDINEIAVDSVGNVWISSEKYLSRFDGTNWKTYITAPRPLSSVINKVVFDKNGTAWIATDWGLTKLKGDTVIQKYDGFERQITALAVDRNNTLWIGEYGLTKYDGITKTNFNTSNSPIPTNSVSDIKLDSKGNVWFPSGPNLVKFDGLNWTVYPCNFAVSAIYRFEIDPDDVIWMASLGDGLIKFDGRSWKKYRLSNAGLLGQTISSFALDARGNRWITCIGGSNAQLIRFDGMSWTYFDTTQFKFVDTYFKRVYSDSSRKIWMGSDVLVSCSNATWTAHSINNLHRGSTMKVDKRGNIWEASNQGLGKFDGTKWTVYNTSNSPLPTNNVARLAFDYQDNLWLSTLPSTSSEKGRLMRFNGTNWTTFYVTDAGAHWIAGLEFDSTGNIWIGILSRNTIGLEYGGGLKKFDGLQWISFDVYSSDLPSNSVVDVCLDKDLNLWIGTYGGGLAKLGTNGTWKVYDVNNSGLPFNSVEEIEIDAMNNKWLGVQISGLTVFREGGAILTEVHDKVTGHNPRDLSLSQNYPNPFNPTTNFELRIANFSAKGGSASGGELVTLKVFDVLGREISTLVNEMRPAGVYKVRWDASSLPSGVYFYRLQAGAFTETKKMVLMK